MYTTLQKNIARGLFSAVVMAATNGYAATPAPAVAAKPAAVQPACQASWYQCIKQDYLNPKPGYVSAVVDQYLAGRKIVISLEDLFVGKTKKPRAEQICDEGAGRFYDLMLSEAERKDTMVRAYFVNEIRPLCSKKNKLPNKRYPWMQYKGK